MFCFHNCFSLTRNLFVICLFCDQAQGIRPDGRQPTRARPVAISGNECPMICRIGNSMVACGVKLVSIHIDIMCLSRDLRTTSRSPGVIHLLQELAAPKAETPDEGYFGISHHKNKFYVQIVINIMLFSTLWNA